MKLQCTLQGGLQLPLLEDSKKTKKIQKEKEAEGLVIKNAFTLFIKEKRENVEKELGVITSTEVNKLLAERWNLLAPDQREKYIAEATVDAILYAMKNPGRSHKINYIDTTITDIQAFLLHPALIG
ncbi:non-histone chromosomal protein 6-like [Gouania willdenowi]|uniref:non-histone chromosomal protein 6-like n=1 Tax=Gouania willdenowi TaxID=441366 RepID=UPI0010556F9C|nr:non-histone chromosomal protein 6-like [Gouania willdenowi]